MIGGSVSKITVEIGGKLAKSLTRSLRSAQTEVSSFSRNVSRTFNDAAMAGRSAFMGVAKSPAWQMSAVAAAGIGAGLVSATRVAIDFKRQMSSVAAKMGNATQAQLSQLGNLAKELGATTKFTASETAAAMDFLAMAGFKTNQILAATPGVLNLAAVGNMELAEAADITSNILGGMGMEVAKTNRLIDVLAKTSTSGNTSVTQLGEAFKSVGPVAKTARASIEDVGASLAVLGDRGIQAEEAGTALRNVFVRLASPPSEAAKALDRLGVSTKDAAGNMRPFQAILGDMNRRMKEMNLGSAEQIELQSDVFGLRALAAGQILQEATATGELAKRIDTVTNSQGAASKMAKTMGDNLGGAFTRLGSAVEGFQLALAGPNSKALQGLVDGLANVVGGATRFLNTFPQIGGVIVGVSAAFVGLVAIAPFLAGFIAVAKSLGGALIAMKVGLVALTGPVGLAIAGVVGIGIALRAAYKKVTWFRDGVNAIWNGIGQTFQGVTSFLGGAWKVFTGILIGDANRARDGVVQAFSGLRQIFSTIFDSIKQTAISAFQGIVSFVRSVPGMLVGVGQAIIDTIINGIKARASALVATVKATFAEVRKLMPFSDAKEGPFKYLTASGKSIVGTLAEGVTIGSPVLTAAFTNAADQTMRAFTGPVPTPVMAAASPGGAATVNLNPTINVNVGGSNANPDDIADTVLRAFQAMLSDAEAGVRAFLND